MGVQEIKLDPTREEIRDEAQETKKVRDEHSQRRASISNNMADDWIAKIPFAKAVGTTKELVLKAAQHNDTNSQERAAECTTKELELKTAQHNDEHSRRRAPTKDWSWKQHSTTTNTLGEERQRKNWSWKQPSTTTNNLGEERQRRNWSWKQPSDEH